MQPVSKEPREEEEATRPTRRRRILEVAATSPSQEFASVWFATELINATTSTARQQVVLVSGTTHCRWAASILVASSTVDADRNH